MLVLDDGRYSITGGQELVDPEGFRFIAGAFPGVELADAVTRAVVADCVRDLPRPAIVLAAIDERAWPGPSPFVDPHRVLARFSERATGL